MTALAMTPQQRQRTRHDTIPSFVLALAMHLLLFGGISLVVRWNTADPAPVVAELWSMEPPVEVAPPPPPPPAPKAEEKPEPPKPDADIVLKEEKKVEPKKIEEKKPPPKKEEAKKDLLAELLKKQEARDRAERERLRQAEAERILAQMAADRPAQPGAGSARDAEYRERLAALIRSRIVYPVPEGTSPSVYADVQVDLLPTGEVAAIKVVKPSGLPGYDEAVERAIRRTDPFPRKPDGTVDRTIVIRFRPVDTPR